MSSLRRLLKTLGQGLSASLVVVMIPGIANAFVCSSQSPPGGDGGSYAGASSISCGINNDAVVSDYSTAVGYMNSVTGLNSSAFGNNNGVSGDNSTALGASNGASALNSVSIGSSNSADALNSTALGYNNHASGLNSIALGPGNIVVGPNAIGIGSSTRANHENSIAIGNGAGALNVESIAIGNGARALNVGSIALGSQSITSSQHIGDFNTIAGGSAGIAGAAGQPELHPRQRRSNVSLATRPHGRRRASA